MGEGGRDRAQVRRGRPHLVIAMDSCSTLDSTGRTNFRSANRNRGVHYVVGHEALAADSTDNASTFASALFSVYNVGAAWKYASQLAQSSDRVSISIRFTNPACNTGSDPAYSVSCGPTSSSSSYVSRWSN